MKSLDLSRVGEGHHGWTKRHRRHRAMTPLILHFTRHIIEVIKDLNAVTIRHVKERQQVALGDGGHQQLLWIPEVGVATESLRRRCHERAMPRDTDVSLVRVVPLEFAIELASISPAKV